MNNILEVEWMSLGQTTTLSIILGMGLMIPATIALFTNTSALLSRVVLFQGIFLLIALISTSLYATETMTILKEMRE